VMAATLWQAAGGEARARGKSPADTVYPEAVEALAELGLTPGVSVPSKISPEDLRWAELVIRIDCSNEVEVPPGSRTLDWSLPVPSGQGLEGMRGRRGVTWRVRLDIRPPSGHGTTLSPSGRKTPGSLTRRPSLTLDDPQPGRRSLAGPRMRTTRARPDGSIRVGVPEAVANLVANHPPRVPPSGLYIRDLPGEVVEPDEGTRQPLLTDANDVPLLDGGGRALRLLVVEDRPNGVALPSPVPEDPVHEPRVLVHFNPHRGGLSRGGLKLERKHQHQDQEKKAHHSLPFWT
jgi:hypothetical protein